MLQWNPLNPSTASTASHSALVDFAPGIIYHQAVLSRVVVRIRLYRVREIGLQCYSGGLMGWFEVTASSLRVARLNGW